ncbi:hypothetical protein CHLNCDRAFT_135377 [Chlorella variabilis]|uniref:Uncharacterized protein n=1 Tax=Chlorella variabilis TaxID=554065 RepID=E1ZI35_CHLVA|nr:hypothetical protein CHLNCDRAFT_135377 [Chlorella variabilis]EFN54711.1 hypothetical protein CHLNCDRAFT_135377 [Chlorella variabilis]|eukprot:XP_005846813.1 hypothetical protein CHLNCDRAFT_135377 [Chlorella variabilis]
MAPRVGLAAFALLAMVVLANAVDVKIGYKPILRSSASVPGTPFKFGQVLTKNLRPIYTVDDAGVKTSTPLISNEPDFSSLHKVGSKLFLITHFESPRPGSMYVVELNQAANGTLTPNVTPWNTRLAGEATDLDSLKELFGGSWGDVEGFMKYYGLYPNQLTFANVKANFNPYRYGHIVENTIKMDGSVTVEKYYTMGRAAWELAYVMPDRRTVYITDDGTNVAFFKFVADKPGVLSAGSLYAAKFTQTGNIGGGRFDIDWILLGKGKNGELKALGESTKFSDIFETASFDAEAKTCPAGFKSINQDDVGPECLKLKTGMAKAAALLAAPLRRRQRQQAVDPNAVPPPPQAAPLRRRRQQAVDRNAVPPSPVAVATRRYAAMKGATTEFSK